MASGSRLKFPVVNGEIHRRGASLYMINCDEDLDEKLERVLGPFLPNVPNLDKYRRFDVLVPHDFPTYGTSFAAGTYIYYTAINRSGQHLLGRTFKGLLSKISQLYKVKRLTHPQAFPLVEACVDDFFRKHLKAISAWAFPRVFSEGPGYMFFMHGDMLGGHAPWTEQQVLNDIEEWISGRDQGNFEILRPYIDTIFQLWPRDAGLSRHLDFKSFCQDPLRWGTSGGAKKATIDGESYRSKWAWAWSRLMGSEGLRDVDLYQEACREENVCVVALKEEEKKTREIITTPMASYLRQSYLAYRWGNLPGDTPLSQPRWLGDFQGTKYAWYGCADADRFDHSVSKEMCTHIIRQLGTLDDECRRVAEEEIASFEGLIVRWRTREWVWKGGLMSGWRFTSMIGTLMSLAIGRFIIDDLHLIGAHAIAMGDDIMIASPLLTATRSQLYTSYAKTGFRVNLLKTTAGTTGEFLRQTYSDKGVLGYPANGLSAVIYSPPWLERYVLEKEQEISKSWLTFYSRLLPHSLDNESLRDFFETVITLAVRQQTKVRGPLKEWLATPISAGGGGPVEWSNPRVWSSIVVNLPDLDTAQSFLSLFGITAKAQVRSIHATKRIDRVDILQVKHDCSNLNRITISTKTHVPKWVNKTQVLLSWFLSKDKYKISDLESGLETRLPRGLHGSRKLQVVKYVLGVEKSPTGFCSVQTTVAATGHYQARMASITRVAASNRRLYTARWLPAIATMYTSQLFANVRFVSGTW